MHTFLIYAFPLVLLLFEWGVRSLMEVDTSGFTGPALAAAALSFLIPLTRPKSVTVSVSLAPRLRVVSAADQHFSALVWLLVLLFLFLWAGACYASVKHPEATLMTIDLHLFIGLVLYLVSVVCCFIKERV